MKKTSAQLKDKLRAAKEAEANAQAEAVKKEQAAEAAKRKAAYLESLEMHKKLRMKRRSAIRDTFAMVNDPLREVIFRAAMGLHRGKLITNQARSMENPPMFMGEFTADSYEAICEMLPELESILFHAADAVREREALEHDVHEAKIK